VASGGEQRNFLGRLGREVLVEHHERTADCSDEQDAAGDGVSATTPPRQKGQVGVGRWRWLAAKGCESMAASHRSPSLT